MRRLKIIWKSQTLTQSYEALCAHYRVRALKLKGGCDFADIKAYRTFLEQVSARLNKRCQLRFREEQQALQALPGERFIGL